VNVIRRANPPSVRLPLLAVSVLWQACSGPEPAPPTADLSAVHAAIEARMEAFHAADTSMNAEAVIALLWPDYEMLVDGRRLSFIDVARGSRDFMAGLESFHTAWTDLEIVPLAPNLAVASFVFRDSILTSDGRLLESRGPTTLIWEKRGNEWRMRFGDADHYPIIR
jgi:ketosteroid isomerase-like protein